MILEISFKGGFKDTIKVKLVCMDYIGSMGSIYYELPGDEEGQGIYKSIDYIDTWKVIKEEND